MKRIIIKNFGAIRYFEMDIKKVNILIGSQASGKSTIAKSLFLVESVQKELVEYIKNISSKNEITHLLQYFNKRLKSFFVEIFGTTKHMNRFEIEFIISKDKNLKFYLTNDGWVRVNYSKLLKNEIEKLKKDLDEFLMLNKKLELNPFDDENITKRIYIFKNISKRIEAIFDSRSTIEYIPAGRSLLTVFAEQIGEINRTKLDLVTKRYIEKIINLKKIFVDDLNMIVENFKQYDVQKIDFKRVRLAIEIIQKILKGNYKFEDGEERIYFEKNRYVKINFASSGQQEAIWILNQIYYLILHNISTFLIVEEPEAHLYPEAQKNIVELMALFGNKTNNSLLITTHSPYILSSLNNLLYAGKLYKNGFNINFIDKDFSVNIDDINTYFIEDGKKIDIIDYDLGEIKAEAIDNASEIINDEYNRLMDMENV
jgi:predicted ATPase